MRRRTKNILITIAVLIGTFILLFFAGTILAGKDNKSPVSQSVINKESGKHTAEKPDLSALFPDEESTMQKFINECGQFTAYIESCINEGNGTGMQHIINHTALYERTGYKIDLTVFSDEIKKLKASHMDSDMIVEQIAVIEKHSTSSPDAIISAKLCDLIEEPEPHYDLENAYPVYLYVYKGKDGHIESFFFSEMEEGKLGAYKKEKP